MSDTHTLSVGFFVTCWMVMFFAGSAIGLRKAHDKSPSTAEDDSLDRR